MEQYEVLALLDRIESMYIHGESLMELTGRIRGYLLDPNYVRLPVEPTGELMDVYEEYKMKRYNSANVGERFYAKHLHSAIIEVMRGEG